MRTTLRSFPVTLSTLRPLGALTLALVVTLAGAQPVRAELTARGPVSAANGFPTWYQDAASLALTLCLDQTPLGPVPGPTACPLPPQFDPDPASGRVGPVLPITQDKAVTPISDATFPAEAFYYMASNGRLVSPTGAIDLTLYEAALEGGFGAAVVDGGQSVFSRIRIRADVTVPGTYTVTHPYGVETFNVTTIDNGSEINFSNDVPGLTPGLFDVVLTGAIGFGPPIVGPRFLTNADGSFFTHPITGAKYVGDNATPVQVQGGLNGVNSVTITGPTDTLTFDTFVLSGKVLGLEITPPGTGTDFGTARPGGPTVAKTFSVLNLTGLPIDPVIVANDPNTSPVVASSDFTIAASAVNPCAPGLLAGASCNFDVVFSPAVGGTDGAKSATILITAGAAVPATSTTVTGSSDGTGPTVAIATPANNTFINVNTPLFTFTATDVTGPVANVVSLDTAVIPTLSGENLALLADGQHTVAVESTDAVGNVSTVTSTFTVDTVVPAASVTAPAVGALTQATTPLSFSATDLNLASTVVKVDGLIVTPSPATLGPLTDGAHSVTIEATDAAGNVTTVTNNFTADGTAPVIEITSPSVKLATPTAVSGTIGITSPVLTFPVTDTNADPTQTTVSLDGIPLVNPVSGVTTLGPFIPGVSHTLTVSATDLAGNVTTSSKTFSLLLADGAMTSLGASPPSIGDVLLALRVVAQLETLAPTSDTFKHGDVAPLVNGVPDPDGEITIGDVLLILRKVAQLVTF